MNLNTEDKNLRFLGRMGVKPLLRVFGKLQTDEIVITNERIEHIIEQHREDYDLFLQYAVSTVTEPDLIIRDCKNTGTIFMVKRLSDINVNAVVRVALDIDKQGLKNSIITFYRLRDANLKKLIRKNELLYKRE